MRERREMEEEGEEGDGGGARAGRRRGKRGSRKMGGGEGKATGTMPSDETVKGKVYICWCPDL